jgi:FAD dependent oxidoreductase TIGR03364
MNKSAIVIGAGIVGLATARALALKGFVVTVIERTYKAVGASIRNFGMVWPIGQPVGGLYERALRSKAIWMDIADSTGMWYKESGSLHTAYHSDEWLVLQELNEIFRQEGREVSLMTMDEITESFGAVNGTGLLGGLYSKSEMIVDPRVAISTAAAYLEEYLDVQFIWGKAVTQVTTGKVQTGKEQHQADLVVVCSGADFETLYPELFSQMAITKCKLQMMRFTTGAANEAIGTSLCGGLSLIHYNSFKAAPGLEALRKRYEAEMPEYISNGIHVMVSQNNLGELTVGDSHHYGLTHDPFDRAAINQLVMDYLSTFANTQNWQLIQSWNGIYPKLQNGEHHVFLQAEPEVYILNGLGGAGMTLSFGLAEECFAAF